MVQGLKFIILAALCLGLSASAWAEPLQGVTEVVAAEFSGPHFFAAMIAGVVLAIAFQLLMTNLSVAAGVSAVSIPGAGGSSDAGKSRGKDKSVGESARKISSMFGVWTLLTTSIALFFSTLLAIELSRSMSALVGAILGLVIWGLFYLVMMTIEATALASMVGWISRLAVSGFRSAYEGLASVFSKSEEKKMADTATEITEAVRNELFQDVDASRIRQEIQKYVDQLEPPDLQPKRLRKELAKLLDETEIAAVSSDDTVMDEKVIAATFENSGVDGQKARETAGKVKQVISTIREEMGSEKDRPTAAADAAMRVAGMSPQQAQEYRKKIEEYLLHTGKEELHPDSIKQDLERMFSDPKGGAGALKERVAQMDKSTISSILAQREDLDREQAEEIVERVNQIINQFKAGMQPQTPGSDDVKNRVLNKIRTYLESTGRPELQYDTLQQDMQRIFADPKATPEVLINRLQAMDRETLKGIIAGRKDMSEEDAERLLNKMEETRDNFIQKAQQMKAEVERRLQEAKQQALRQAEEARKTAATAAWWAFGTAVVSGIAAVIGGMLGAGG